MGPIKNPNDFTGLPLTFDLRLSTPALPDSSDLWLLFSEEKERNEQ